MQVGGRERLADGDPGADRAGRSAEPAPDAGAWRGARSGVAAYTSRTVSLNWRTLANPAAKAMSAKVRSVVSISTRAVWARRDRARASGPAPYSWVTTRLSWRVE